MRLTVLRYVAKRGAAQSSGSTALDIARLVAKTGEPSSYARSRSIELFVGRYSLSCER